MRIIAEFEPKPERRALLLRNDVHPYEYMDDWSRFLEVTLPQNEAFYSKLSDEGISDEDFSHGLKVWETFSCATLGDYHDLYLRRDVLLLADVFENIHGTCLISTASNRLTTTPARV